jgi:hypothetical protein
MRRVENMDAFLEGGKSFLIFSTVLDRPLDLAVALLSFSVNPLRACSLPCTLGPKLSRSLFLSLAYFQQTRLNTGRVAFGASSYAPREKTQMQHDSSQSSDH